MARSFDAAAIELIGLGREQHVYGELHHRPDYRQQKGRAVLRECLGKIDKSLIPLVLARDFLQHEVAR